jgi:hypothetical protein
MQSVLDINSSMFLMNSHLPSSFLVSSSYTSDPGNMRTVIHPTSG